MIKTTSKLRLTLIIVFLLLLNRQTIAQNCQPSPSTDCGVVTANSGLSSSNVFCAGDSVGICNNNSTGTIDSTYICWGDGTINWYAGIFTGCKKHKYNFPVDSCVTNGSLGINIVFGVKDECSAGLTSRAWNLTPITIKFKPKAKFNISPNPACVYEPITITDQSCPNANPTVTYLWDFGDGTSSTSQNAPTHSYSNPGTYTITLTITNNCGTSTDSRTVTIKPPTTVAPVIALPNLCSPNNFTPDVNSQNVVSFLWSFSNGSGNINMPPDSQPIITLPTAGTYGIQLAVTGCCSSPVSKCNWDTTLTVYNAPITNVSNIPDFCGNASFNPLSYFQITGGPINSYSWTFQGGSPSTSTSPTPGNVTYSSLGTYIVSLVLNTPCGNITLRDTFSILPPTIVRPIVVLPSVCAPVTFIPDVNSQNATGFNWTIIGGSNLIISPQDSQPSISLNTNGNFTINLQAQGCCTAPTSDCTWDTSFTLLQGASINQSFIPDFCGSTILTPASYISAAGAITSYSWSFPGGSPASSNVANPGNITYAIPGTYIVQLNVNSPCGPQNVSDTFVVRPPTIVQPNVILPSACSPVSFVPDVNSQNATGYNWTVIGGSNIITSPQDSQPSIALNTSGNITINLLAQGCCTAPTSDCVWDTSFTLLQGASINQSFIPDFCGSTVLTPANYISAAGAITSYSWSFPGGSPASSNVANPGNITYAVPGTYTIQLNVTSPCGPQSVSDIFIINPPTIIQPISNISGICTPLAFVPEINSVNATGFLWSTLAGSATITQPTDSQPSFLVNNIGLITIQVAANGCCIDPQSKCTWDTTLTLTEGPAITTSAIPLFCNSAIVNPSNYFSTSGGITSYSWSFPGGIPATSVNASPGAVNYSSPGVYVITLTLNGPCGTVTKTETVNVGSPPVSSILPSSLFGCDTLTISLLNNSPVNQTYLWTAAGGTFVGGTTSSSISPSIFFNSPGAYAVNVETFSAGCPSITNSFSVNIGEAPKIQTIASTPDVCDTMFFTFSNYFQLTPTISDSGYNWTIFYNGNNIFSNSTSNPPSIQIGAYGQYIVNASVWNGCDTILLTDTFNINPPETIVLNSDTIVCKGSGVINLTATPVAGDWTWNGNSITSGFFNPNNTQQVSNYLLYSYGALSCAVKDSFLITVLGADINAGLDTVFCSNSDLHNFVAVPPGGVWSGAGIIDSITGLYNPSLPLANLDTLIYSYINTTYNCIVSDTLFVTIFRPTLGSFIIPDTACINQPVLFSNTAPGTSSIWDLGDGSGLYYTNTITHTYNNSGQYNISLIFENQYGCKDTVNSIIEIVQLPDASFALDTIRGCSVLPITFTNLSTFYGSNVYAWNYGNGIFDTIYNPGTIYFNQGPGDSTIYNILLTVSNGCGVATYTDSITVYPIPVPDFGVVYNDSCSPARVTFNNITTGQPQFFEWYINGVFISSDSILPAQIFLADSTDSTYVITLVASNRCGTDSISKSVIIRPNQVTAFFNTDYTFGCKPLKVTFTSVVAANSIINWDFGDGNTASGGIVTHTFDTSGVFTIWQYVDNFCGFDSISQVIEVLPQPDLSFDITPKACDNVEVEILNTSLNLSGYSWNFGDLSDLDTINYSPSHTFNTPGQYQVILIGYADNTGCSDTISKFISIVGHPIPDFSFSTTDGCSPLQVILTSNSANTAYYIWSMGNSDSLTGNNVSYIYTNPGQYSINLTVIDTNLCQDDSTYNFINVFPVPIADFTYSQFPLCEMPTTINFSNNSIDANYYQWDMGIYGQSLTENPTLPINSATTFNCSLIVQNSFNCRDTIQKAIRVYDKPIANFTPEKASGCVEFGVFFNNISSNANGSIWSFGTGDSSTQFALQYVYPTVGTYTVSLIAHMDSVCFDTLTIINAINVLPIPTADFTFTEVTDTIVNPSGIYSFNDASINSVSWNWDFGDGSLDEVQQNPIHRFENNGIFYVTLTVLNSDSCPDTITKAVLVDYLSSLFIPNAFSPDAGTEQTRFFIPKGAGLSQFHIEIFSPYGEKVWDSDQLINGRPSDSWDGTFNGKPLPQGAYVWQANALFQNGKIWSGMSYNDEKPQRVGSVMIIR